jgi:acyl-coenzyme A thioesterase PaaI-like protein
MKHPARDDLEGNVVKAGRSLVVNRGEGHAETAGKRTLVALMQQRRIVMHGKSEL